MQSEPFTCIVLACCGYVRSCQPSATLADMTENDYYTGGLLGEEWGGTVVIQCIHAMCPVGGHTFGAVYQATYWAKVANCSQQSIATSMQLVCVSVIIHNNSSVGTCRF